MPRFSSSCLSLFLVEQKTPVFLCLCLLRDLYRPCCLRVQDRLAYLRSRFQQSFRCILLGFLDVFQPNPFFWKGGRVVLLEFIVEADVYHIVDSTGLGIVVHLWFFGALVILARLGGR